MTSPPGVRLATPADAFVVGGLLFDFNTEFDAPTPSAADLGERFASLLARPDVLVVLAEAPATGEATGFGYLTLRPTPYGDGPLAQLEELYVVPGLRDRGIGTALLTRALAEVEQRGRSRCTSTSTRSTSTRAGSTSATASPTSSPAPTTGCCAICGSSGDPAATGGAR